MRINIFNGALEGDRFCDLLASSIKLEYQSLGHSVTYWRLRDYDINHCTACLECWTHTPGLCVIEDDAQRLLKSILTCEVLVFVTPITFGGVSSECKKLFDRCVCLVEPALTVVDGLTQNKYRYDRPPAIRAIGLLPNPDEVQEAIFRQLIDRYASSICSPRQAVDIIYRPTTSSTPARPVLQPQGIGV